MARVRPAAFTGAGTTTCDFVVKRQQEQLGEELRHVADRKRFSICKEVSYCGAAHQKANWKRHKKTCTPPVPGIEVNGCAPPLSLSDVADKVNALGAARDWRGMLKFEGRMEEMIAHQAGSTCVAMLVAFSWAHQEGLKATGSKDHARSIVRLEERRIPLLGNLERFRDQGEAMCTKGKMLLMVLELARFHLKVLDPEVGDTELIEAVAVEALKLLS